MGFHVAKQGLSDMVLSEIAALAVQQLPYARGESSTPDGARNPSLTPEEVREVAALQVRMLGATGCSRMGPGPSSPS
eukprot:12040682-Heterocapsa_arctica.AAC.1